MDLLKLKSFPAAAAGAFFVLFLSLFFSPAASGAPATGFPEPGVGYSALSFMETDSATLRSKVYYMPGKERREMESGTIVMIARRDMNVVWQLLPGQNSYIEHELSGAGASGSTTMRDYRADFEVEREELGGETVGGVQATKSRFTMKGPEGREFSGFMWTTAEGIMVRMEAVSSEGGKEAGLKLRLEELRIGPQDPSLFEVPPGYEKADMPKLDPRGMDRGLPAPDGPGGLPGMGAPGMDAPGLVR